MRDSPFDLDRFEPVPCVSLIGMAGAGKSTLGKMLAGSLNMAHLDTDRLIESLYGLDLQDLLDAMGRQEFLRIEDAVVGALGVKRCVISTGGSVIYGARAMAKLKSLGPVIFLAIDHDTFHERTGDLAGRGFVPSADGLTPAQVFAERDPLYRGQADFIADACLDPDECLAACTGFVRAWLQRNIPLAP